MTCHKISSAISEGLNNKIFRGCTPEPPFPSPVLPLRASVNGLTFSPSVLYGAHYSSHQHPSPHWGEVMVRGVSLTLFGALIYLFPPTFILPLKGEEIWVRDSNGEESKRAPSFVYFLTLPKIGVGTLAPSTPLKVLLHYFTA